MMSANGGNAGAQFIEVLAVVKAVGATIEQRLAPVEHRVEALFRELSSIRTQLAVSDLVKTEALRAQVAATDAMKAQQSEIAKLKAQVSKLQGAMYSQSRENDDADKAIAGFQKSEVEKETAVESQDDNEEVEQDDSKASCPLHGKLSSSQDSATV